jgi:arylsulfatase A-like enzyme
VKSSTRLDPDLPTLGKILKGQGYATAHFGKWHLGLEPHSPLELGFDVDIPHWHGPGPKTGYLAPWGYANFKEGKPGEHIEDRMAKEAVAWLKNRDRTQPFYMNYWQFSVHAPFGAKPELIDRYRKKIKRGEAQQSPTYAAMVHSLDDAVGSLLDALDEEGIADQTLIVFYSDNGGNIHCGLEETEASGEKYTTAITSNHPLRGGKGGIHEGGIRVPAVVVWPGSAKPGSTSDVRIQSNDLYPTILKMLEVGQKKGHIIDGVDFSQALHGKNMDRGPMFTLVPGHGNTPQWLPPSMAVHDGDWKLIRTFHYGEDGRHAYRLYNLREDIGESNNLAAEHPEKVKTMDRLIEDYIAEAKVVVPLPNPKFEAPQYDPATIGVQKGGLKMPKTKGPKTKKRKPQSKRKTPPAAPQKNAKSSKPVNGDQMLGWTARGGAVSLESHSLRIKASGGKLFLANAKVRANGPMEFKLRIRTQGKGTGKIQWRTADQKKFPKSGQSKSFTTKGEGWQELTVPLPVKGELIHLRLFPPAEKKPVEIDWIEITPIGAGEKKTQRWDFKGAAKSKKVEKQEPEKPKNETPHIDRQTAEGMKDAEYATSFPEKDRR